MLLRVKYRFGTPAWFLTPWADQELQHQSQGPVVIYTGTLGTRWEKTASTKKKMVKGGAQGQQAGKSSNLSFYQQIKKKGKKKRKKKRIIKEARETPLTSVERLPDSHLHRDGRRSRLPFLLYAPRQLSAPYQSSHTDVSSAETALEVQKAALDGKYLSTETINHAGFRLNISLSKVPCRVFSASIHFYMPYVSELVQSSLDQFGCAKNHLSSLSCNPSYEPLKQLKISQSVCSVLKLKLRLESHTVVSRASLSHINDSNCTDPVSDLE